MEKLNRRIFVHKKQGNISVLLSIDLLIDDLVYMLDKLTDKGYGKQVDLSDDEFQYYVTHRDELGMYWFDIDNVEDLEELLTNPLL